jgi:hypothetical protein
MRLCEALRRPGLYVEREREPDGAARLTVVENVPDCADNREIMARAQVLTQPGTADSADRSER